MHLSWFLDFILCPIDKYIFKVNDKKNLKNLLNVFKVKSKHSMTSFRCFYCWHWPQSANHYSVSTFNFEQVFVSRVRKASLNVLKKQKAIYLCRNKSCKSYFVQRFIIALNWNKWWTFDNISAWNLLKCIIVSSRCLICYIIAIP